jgi:SpoVK/Ycf46/Vps4 family AAA+-type ATPase
MQEKKSPSFVVATANDISQLPPELLRKCRFDEIFYVPFPSSEEREKIFEVHLKKRNQEKVLSRSDISALVSKTEGYSGADIEGVVGEGVERAFINNREKLTIDRILESIEETRPLSKIMSVPPIDESKLSKLEKMKNLYRDFKEA